MSTNFTAYAVIGVVVSRAHLYKVEIIPHTEHAIPEGAMYCPTCGKSATTRELVPLFDEDTWSIGPFSLITSYSDDRVAFGFVADEQDYYVDWRPDDKKSRSLPLPDIDDLKDRLHFHLAPLGLYDESTFGLHAILHVG